MPDNSLETVIPHPDLKQITPFTPLIDAITEPGDLLYIPPNHPHNGTAIDESLNYSIGFQAPNSQELWSGFADKLLDKDIGKLRFGDPDRKTTTQPHKLSNSDIDALKQYMLKELDDETTFTNFIGEQLTECQHTLELLPPDETIHDDELIALIDNEDITLSPVLGIKTLMTENDEPCLFVCGEQFVFDEESAELALILSQKQIISPSLLKSSIRCLKNVTLLTRILNKGFWYIDETVNVAV